MIRIRKIILIDGLIAAYWLALWLSNPHPGRTAATVWDYDHKLIYLTYPPRDLKDNLLSDGPNIQRALGEESSELIKKLEIVRNRR